MTQLPVLPLERFTHVGAIHEFSLQSLDVLFQIDCFLDEVLSFIRKLLDLKEQVCLLLAALEAHGLLQLQLVDLVLQILVLHQKAFHIRVFAMLAVSEDSVLTKELLYARDQFEFFLCRQVLVLVEEELEFVLKAFDKLIKRDLVLLVRQLGQLLHRAVSLIAFEHDCVQDLGHHEEVVDFFPEDVIKRRALFDLKLVRNGGSELALASALAFRA